MRPRRRLIRISFERSGLKGFRFEGFRSGGPHMSARKTTMLSVILLCAAWALAQSAPPAGSAPRSVTPPPGTATPPAHTETPPARTATPPAGAATPQIQPGSTPSGQPGSSTVNPNTQNTPGTPPSGSPCGTLPGTAGRRCLPRNASKHQVRATYL
jgi:hypothetical protein